MDKANGSLETITGRYSYVGNPCTTTPCLPGMAYAVSANNRIYYITVDGHWFSENKDWDNYTPQPNDLVTVTGRLEQNVDVSGKTFHTIEAISLKRAK